jgi:hypothetical protein
MQKTPVQVAVDRAAEQLVTGAGIVPPGEAAVLVELLEFREER